MALFKVSPRFGAFQAQVIGQTVASIAFSFHCLGVRKNLENSQKFSKINVETEFLSYVKQFRTHIAVQSGEIV